MPPAIWYPLQLENIISETKSTRRFLFRLDTPVPFEYQPGQFLTCDLPIGEKRAQRWRSYSIANNQLPNNEIEFCISYKENGLASAYFFETIKIGDQFKCKGPEGTFVLPDQTDINLFLICTGTGLAPFRAMIQNVLASNTNFNAVHLIYGTRNSEDIIYKSELSTWPLEILNFNTHICLSRETHLPQLNSKNYTYNAGYVHSIYKDIFNKNKMDPAKSIFLICGWSTMIDEAVLHLFSELKIPRQNIRFELYG